VDFLNSYVALIMFGLANGGDRLRQEPERSSRCMPGYLMQLVKTRREKTTANNNELALAA
jgi:hypothetical protein